MEPPRVEVRITQRDIIDGHLTLQPNTNYTVTKDLQLWQITFGGDNITLNLDNRTIFVKSIIIIGLNTIKIHSPLSKPNRKRAVISNDFGLKPSELVTLLHQLRSEKDCRFSWLPKDIINHLATIYSIHCADPTTIIHVRQSKELSFVNFDIEYRAVPDFQAVNCVGCASMTFQEVGVKNH